MQRVAIVIPVYNEEAVIEPFYQKLKAVIDRLDYAFSLCFVNDGSSDDTASALARICAQDGRVKVVELSRNFGHQAALTAGLDQADADFIISLDGDGEHPPELIPQMLELAQTGYEVVLTQRSEAQQAAAFKRWSSDAFYRFINRIADTRVIPGAGDYRLLARPALEALRQMPEYHRFLRGMVAWIGFRSVILPYTPAQRLGGRSKYSLKKMLRLGMNATFSFSLVPLYASLSLGGIFLLLALVEAIYVLSFWIGGRQAGLAPGWSSLMFVLLVVGGMVMVTLGVIGIYLGYIFQEAKHRPVYIVRRVLADSAQKEPEDAA